MAEYTVFGASVPDVVDNNDNDDYSLGTVVLIAPTPYGGRIVRARHYATTTPPTAPIAWRVSDLITLDLLGSHVFVDQTPGWVEEELDPPIDIPAGGQQVVAWIGTPNRYVNTGTYFTTGAGAAGVTNGPLTAPASADDPAGIGNGRFGGDDESVPQATINGGNYFIDLVFEPNEAPPPASGEAAFSLALAVASAGDAPDIPPAEGTAAFGLTYTISGVGETPPIGTAEGSAAFSLALALASTGDAPAPGEASGTAGFGLVYAISGTGNTPVPGQASGTASFSLGLTLDAAGDNGGPDLPCRPVRSFSEVMS
jgi:hypothetical protein